MDVEVERASGESGRSPSAEVEEVQAEQARSGTSGSLKRARGRPRKDSSRPFTPTDEELVELAFCGKVRPLMAAT